MFLIRKKLPPSEQSAEAFMAALQDLGEAGAKAFKQIQDAIEKIDTKKP